MSQHVSAHLTCDVWLERLAMPPCCKQHAAAGLQQGLCHSCNAYSRDFAIAVMPTAAALPQLLFLRQGLCHSCCSYSRHVATAAVLLVDRFIQLSSAQQLKVLETGRQRRCPYRK